MCVYECVWNLGVGDVFFVVKSVATETQHIEDPYCCRRLWCWRDAPSNLANADGFGTETKTFIEDLSGPPLSVIYSFELTGVFKYSTRKNWTIKFLFDSEVPHLIAPVVPSLRSTPNPKSPSTRPGVPTVEVMRVWGRPLHSENSRARDLGDTYLFTPDQDRPGNTNVSGLYVKTEDIASS